ncbi:uncharacterized protein LOC122262225 [Penaeus japonicus]|uniref:uncharacterized protein LOC122262225 n=1 Tax=Penaeus japonicus TaxID=27405 RepID=UPI001C716139|nr:uncharacterized protein LOC122262225 [Penaeus japonicus]
MITTILLIWAVLASAHPPRSYPRLPSLSQQYYDVAEYPFARIVGVFRIVDGDSCRCVARSRPCPIEIMEDSVFKARGFPCPFLTRYCCQRETLIDLSGAIDRNQNPVDHRNRNSTAGDVNRTKPSHLTPFDTRISTAKSKSSRIHEVSQSADVSSAPVSNVSTASSVSSASKVSSDPDDSGVPRASDASTMIPIGFLPAKNPPRDSDRRGRPSACSCSTRDQCLSRWSEMDGPPEVRVKTSLRCEVPGQVTCCFGRIVPPRHHKSRDPTHSEDSVRHPFKTSRWRPFASAWKNLVSWFKG